MNLPLKILILFLASVLFFSCEKDVQIKDKVNPPVSHKITIDTLAKNLELPWGLVYLPNGDLLFTERNGRINLLHANKIRTTLMHRQVSTNSEGGLLSITIDPDFKSNHFVYIYESVAGGTNHVMRLVLGDTTLKEDKVIVDQIPYALNHDGGALKFGPDNYLYIGTGDITQSPLAQDKNSLAGKILRVDREGTAAPGNPFNSRIWSYGHRNVQGFAWTPDGIMLATEHGPSGEFGWCCHDEVNRIQAGNNYGWPLALAGTETGTLTPPLLNSGDDTWAPSGCTYLGPNSIWPNCLVVCCLRGQRLLRIYPDVSGSTVISKSDTLKDQFFRIRNIIEAPDGALVFCTSNSGSINPPVMEDDKLYRITIK